MKIILFLLLITPVILNAQKANAEPGFYDLNGNFICNDCSVIEICNKRGYKHTNIFVSKKNRYAVVIFEKITNKPLFVNVQKSSDVKNVLKDFRGRNYYHDISFFMDLEDMIKKHILIDGFLIASLGKPGAVFETSDGNLKVQSYDYPKLGLTVYFANSIAVRYLRREI
ncbi:hypothetical protein AB6805_30550 [Chitinophaga sp. RCC_12]|uniref:hypothetical protein n=1 Tax=Chitinophaga sp. RCC_12 TaxID=3239226 RepID=UPI00352685E7